ncbi:MAG: UDP-N-acetylmuramate--L-alanine ligase [Gammaproteobacteria bacterium]|nr:UDP-N-acetylmuramate--L-alanine ligase [Gammaproteobacteria bacterium]
MKPNIPRHMQSVNHIHFVGIGGGGMSGIAEVLWREGYQISGSDLHQTSVTEHLSQLGINVFYGHAAEQVQGADVLVVSSAISPKNPEFVAAASQGIPIVPRAEMLSELMRFRHGIAVAGSHGKTTTTSLIASLLTEGGLDPTFVIGGRLNSTGTHAGRGESHYLVVEADESDASFLYLQPMIAVVTNIEAEHLPHYDGDFRKLKKTFVEFLHHLPFYGLAVLCVDDPVMKELLPEVTRPVIRYGFEKGADVCATEVQYHGLQSTFTVTWKPRHGLRSPAKPLEVKLNLPGRHNVQNALAAITVAMECGVEEAAIVSGLASFAGIARRFQIHPHLRVNGREVLLVDDYGHHPTELSVTIETIRSIWPDRRLVMVFQPHRYTRTRDCWDEFSEVLAKVQVLLLLEVYSAGEEPIPGVDSKDLSRSIRGRGGVEPIWVGSLERLPDQLGTVLKDGDVLLLQGAGSIGKVGKELGVRGKG